METEGEIDSVAVFSPNLKSAEGYVYLWGDAQQNMPMRCPLLVREKCVFYEYSKLKLSVIEDVVCGDASEGKNIKRIQKVQDRCLDSNEVDCQQCWKAKISKWNVFETHKQSRQFKMGVNIIEPKDAVFKYPRVYEDKEFEIKGERFREIVEYIDIGKDILVVGDAKYGVIKSGTPFIISTRDYESTIGAIAEEGSDDTALRMQVLAVICMFIGLLIIVILINALVDAFGSIPHLVDAFIGLSRLRGPFIPAFCIAWTIMAAGGLFVSAIAFRSYSNNLPEAMASASILGYICLIAAGSVTEARRLGGMPRAQKPINVVKDEKIAMRDKKIETQKQQMKMPTHVSSIKSLIAPSAQEVKSQTVTTPEQNGGTDEFGIEKSPERLGDRPKPGGERISLMYIEYEKTQSKSAALIKSYFEKKGYYIDLITGVADALQTITQRKYDIIICDNETSEIGQDITCATIKRMDPRQRVIMYSSRADLLTHEQMSVINADAYIPKKDIEVLVASVRDLTLD